MFYTFSSLGILTIHNNSYLIKSLCKYNIQSLINIVYVISFEIVKENQIFMTNFNTFKI